MKTTKHILIFALLITAIAEVKAQKIFMTGDSHVNSGIYPEKVEEQIRESHPGIDFGWWAKNGICFYSFNSEEDYFDNIFDFNPDILVVHLGTNGAYGTNFKPEDFRKEMDEFYATLTSKLPDVKVVFVTPFTNKKRKKGHATGGKVNPFNRQASDVIIEFAEAHKGTFVIDNNMEVGMTFLNSPLLIKPDNVHLTVEGYETLGKMIGKDLLEIKPLWNN